MGIADALAGSGAIPPADASQLRPNAPLPAGSSKPPDGAMLEQYTKDQDKIETARKERDTIENDRPKYPELAPEPKPDAPDPMQGYTSLIGVLGAIGSMFTRHPLTATMNGAAGAITAMKQSDQAAFDKKFDVWKAQNENAFKLMDYQNKIYDTVLKNKNASVDQRLSEMQAHAAMFKDDYMMQLAKDKNIMEMEELQLKRQEAGEKASEYADKIQDTKDKRDIFAEWKKENPNAKADDVAAAHARIFDPSVAAASVKAQAAADKEFNKNKQNYEQAATQIDDLIDMVDKSPDKGVGVTGATGMARRMGETVETMLPSAMGGNAATPASDFQSKLNTLKLQLPKLLTGTSKSAADERAKVDTILRGTSFGDTPAKTRNALVQLKAIFDKRANRSGDYDTQNYKIGDTVMDPDGTRHKITGFDTDGTPLGEEVK